MAIIRQVRQNKETGKWAYIEYSDENKNHVKIIGDQEFNTEEEADFHARTVREEEHQQRIASRQPKFDDIGRAFSIAWGDFYNKNKNLIDALPDGFASITKMGNSYQLNYSKPIPKDIEKAVEFCRKGFPGEMICACSDCVSKVNNGSWMKDAYDQHDSGDENQPIQKR